jgi:soluble lytic murein transglycosylase-like protein
MLRLRVLGWYSGMLFSLSAVAEVFTYTDAHGITHLSNQAPGTRSHTLLREPGVRRRAPASDGPRGTAAAPWQELIHATARDFQLDVHLLHAIISIESGYNPQARSPKGAVGLMQVMPATGLRFGINDLANPRQNLLAGARYLRSLHTRFNGQLPLILAAYNAGEGAVLKYGNRIPPYPETQDYVARVLASYTRRFDNAASETGGSTADRRTVWILRENQAEQSASW